MFVAFQVQLRAVGVDIPRQPEGEGDGSAALALTLDMLEMPAEELERRFRDVWGNNADEIRCVHVPARSPCGRTFEEKGSREVRPSGHGRNIVK